MNAKKPIGVTFLPRRQALSRQKQGLSKHNQSLTDWIDLF